MIHSTSLVPGTALRLHAFRLGTVSLPSLGLWHPVRPQNGHNDGEHETAICCVAKSATEIKRAQEYGALLLRHSSPVVCVPEGKALGEPGSAGLCSQSTAVSRSVLFPKARQLTHGGDLTLSLQVCPPWGWGYLGPPLQPTATELRARSIRGKKERGRQVVAIAKRR